MAKRKKAQEAQSQMGRPNKAPVPFKKINRDYRNLARRVKALGAVLGAMRVHNIESVMVSAKPDAVLTTIDRLVNEAVASVNETLPEDEQIDPIGIYFDEQEEGQ
jgi:hypothetical protein